MGFEVRTRALILPGGKPREVKVNRIGRVNQKSWWNKRDRHMQGQRFPKFTPYVVDDAHGFITYTPNNPFQPVNNVEVHRQRPRAAGPVKSPLPLPSWHNF